MRAVHERLRKALRVTLAALEEGEEASSATRDLLLFCHGFCTALTKHHEGEDSELFPAIAKAYPELSETLRKLKQDHSMISYMIAGLQNAVEQEATPAELLQHLDGVGSIMENHFRYEERQLLSVLERLELNADPHEALGPL